MVQATAAATITDTASCSSPVIDPLKANNLASVKTIVQAVSMTISRVDGGLAISWPSTSGNYVLESTSDLRPPTVWTPVTDVVPAVVGGQTTVIVPIGPGNRYFRLQWSSVPTLPLSVRQSGNSVVVAWPINSWNLRLESTTNMRPPMAWVPVSSPAPQVSGGQNTVTIPISSGSRFFRLQQAP